MLNRLEANKYAYQSVTLYELKKELFRKTIHLFIAYVPILASINIYFTFLALGSGIVIYTVAELLRFNGISVPIISKATEFASRERDRGKIVLGPVTLAFGAMAALFFYPDPAASLAIYALAFGDGLSSVVGKLFGRLKIPFTGGKSYVGSITCFLAVLLVSYRFTGDPRLAVLTAVIATGLEALPLKDLDNIVIPLGTGLGVYLYLFI